MKKIKRIYVRKIGWIKHRRQDNGEITKVLSNLGKIVFFKQENTLYPKDHIFAIEYYDLTDNELQ